MDSWVAWHWNDCPLENYYCLVKALRGREGWDALYLKVFQPLFSTKTQVSLLTSPNIVVTGGDLQNKDFCKLKGVCYKHKKIDTIWPTTNNRNCDYYAISNNISKTMCIVPAFPNTMERKMFHSQKEEWISNEQIPQI